ncbi:MAG: hypothetical protein CFE38_17890 [Comamonadaceae bacterium PBBC1]|nr:MAG: hypothetical protein CFE38_17890 [Comamonadaceae bacterium PBBC1]
MFSLDFAQTPRKALLRGFLKGMAAPAYIYHVKDLPNLPSVLTVDIPNVDVSKALASDWRAIGLDFDKVIAAYDQKTTP